VRQLELLALIAVAALAAAVVDVGIVFVVFVVLCVPPQGAAAIRLSGRQRQLHGEEGRGCKCI